jgi:hypothetical protein
MLHVSAFFLTPYMKLISPARHINSTRKENLNLEQKFVA